ncbi:MAG: YezD family protein [Pirellulales bacterium]
MASELTGTSGSPSSDGAETADVREARLRQALDHVRQALASLRYGQVVITVQDGVVVQIDRTEKTRLR